ncbi:twin-arginine translocase TatA/TatE family subunit [Nocardioides aurantiacus]|uniref:Sec-independent protein translocase protein TatA n=1 Tax=Nocardioides aurantiacus TaxID=86796 RepID=A0A3N2CT61_9ACTN|nr:twin-arginine translocase TatA/TatE family subunit [Nocardioides aurantiacus]ROR90719.1 sec-independent protein translocase protein TatA [Nocardioides aurantiacus]
MSAAVVTPMIAGLGPTELIIIVGIIVLLFGASKLPELARGSGRALRIFKAETKGLMDDDDKTDAQREIDARAAEADARRDADFDAQHPVRRTDDPGTPGSPR